MNLIDNYLKNEHFLDLNDKHDKASQEAKLEYFFKLFIELEKKYASKIEDMKRLDAEHKQELSQVKYLDLNIITLKLNLYHKINKKNNF